MDSITEMKALWHTASTAKLPDAAEMLLLIKQFRNKRLRKKWMVIVMAALMSFVMFAITFTTHFEMLVTYIGGALIASSGLFLALNNLRSLKRFYRLDDCSNKEFLDFIAQTQLNQIYYYKKTQVILIMLCSVGLLLYLYEPATHHFLFTFLLFMASGICLSYSWWVVRPKNFIKNQEKLEALRQHFQTVSNQLKSYGNEENE